MLKKIVAVGIFAAALGGCDQADVKDFGNQLKAGLTGVSQMGSSHALADVGLANILPEFDPSLPLSQQFPHVAVTVLSSPPGWARVYNMSRVGNGCFTLQAVVWTSAKESHQTPPFQFCPDQDASFTLGPAYLYSLQTPMSGIASGYLSGSDRHGPRPPKRLLPTDNHTQDLTAQNGWQGGSSDLNSDEGSKLAVTFANLRRQMGANIQDTGDFRVWIVSISDTIR